jgi:hypothetical protein
MIEVFKTNVEHHHQAVTLTSILSQQFPLLRIDFDIDDCDRILRVEGETVVSATIIDIMATNGYSCHILD